MSAMNQQPIPAADHPQRAARLRETVARQAGKMTLQLARELGVPELEIIRALPTNRATELDASRWEPIIRSLQRAGEVRVLVSNGATTMEAVGCFGGFSTTGEYFNVQTDSLDLHIRWAELRFAFTVEKPGHVDGQPTHSIQFFDRAGNAAFKVFFSFGEPITRSQHVLLGELQKTFATDQGSAGPVQE
jgi:putative heme iron utilization protein